MKKNIAFIVMTILTSQLFCCVGYKQSGYAADMPENGNYYIRPGNESGRPYIVVLPLSEVLSEYADISFDAENGIVSVTCGTLDVLMEIGSTSYVINGEDAELDVPPEIIDGEIYVPSTFFEKTFGFWTTDTGEGVIDLFMPSFIIDNI